MPEYARVCQSMSEYARVCKSMPECARVYQSVPGYARVLPSFAKVLPKFAQKYNVCVREGNPGVNRALVAPDADRRDVGTHRVRTTHAAPTGCTNTTYASTLRTTLQRCREQFRYRRSNAFPLSPLQPSPPPTSVKSDAPRGEVTCVRRSSRVLTIRGSFRVSTIQGSFPESSRVSTI